MLVPSSLSHLFTLKVPEVPALSIWALRPSSRCRPATTAASSATSSAASPTEVAEALGLGFAEAEEKVVDAIVAVVVLQREKARSARGPAAAQSDRSEPTASSAWAADSPHPATAPANSATRAGSSAGATGKEGEELAEEEGEGEAPVKLESRVPVRRTAATMLSHAGSSGTRPWTDSEEEEGELEGMAASHAAESVG
jgi:hypothetical protein